MGYPGPPDARLNRAQPVSGFPAATPMVARACCIADPGLDQATGPQASQAAWRFRYLLLLR